MRLFRLLLLLLVFIFTADFGYAHDINLHFQLTIGGRIVAIPRQFQDGTLVILSEDRSIYLLKPDGSINHRILTHFRFNERYTLSSDGTMYLSTGPATVSALNLNGDIRWNYRFEVPIISNMVIGPGGDLYVFLQDGSLCVLNPSGYLRWKYRTGLQTRLPIAMDSLGRIIIASDDGFVHAILPWGDEIWQFRLAATPVAYAMFAQSLLCSTTANTLVSIGQNGVLEWQKLFQERIVDIVHDAEYIFALSEYGTVYILDSEGQIHGSHVLNERLDSLFLGTSGLIAAESGSSWFYYIPFDADRERIRVSVGFSMSGTFLSGDGILLSASDNWFLFGLGSFDKAVDGWSQRGGRPYYDWSMLSGANIEYWLNYFEDNSEYLSIRAFMDFALQNRDADALARALDIIEDSLAKPGIFRREPYLVDALGKIILDPISRRPTGIPKPDFYTGRLRAIRLLSGMSTNHAAVIYRELLIHETDSVLLDAVYQAIRNFPSDPGGVNAQLTAQRILSGMDRYSLTTATEALLAMVGYRGVISDDSVREAAVHALRTSSDSGTRRRVLRILRYRRH